MAAARVMIVDDEPAILVVSRSILSRQGYEVTSASSGEEALRIIGRNGPFDLVLSDITMPGMLGPQLLAAVSQSSPSTALMLMSGYAPASAPPGITLLRKPFTAKDLGDAVRECLAAAHLALHDLRIEIERGRELQQQSKQLVNEVEEVIREPRRGVRRLDPSEGQ